MTIFALDIDGGWNTEQGPSASFRLKGTGAAEEILVSVPWLIEAQNIVYSLDGWPRKMPGAQNVNGTATGASDAAMGVFDYWRQQTSGSPTQQRIVYSGTALYRESGGTLTSILSGLEAAKMSWFEVMNDELVWASTSTVDVPQAYDQVTVAALGGSPPNFAFHVKHRGRMWAAGVATAKYRLYYGALDNHEDWTGAGSGSIDLPGQIAGLWSHKDELIIFLGPNEPAINRITGSAPTGSDAFALHPFVRGVGATNQQAIILGPGGDPWFWDDNGIHSLEATAAYGDYAPQFLSADISDYFINQLNHNRFDAIWGVNFSAAGYALWTASRGASTTHDLVVLLDYRFKPLRFAAWPAHALASLAMVRDSSRQTVPWGGTYTGRVRRLHQASKNIAGAAYTATVRLPYLPFGDPFIDKVVTRGRASLAPKGDATFTLGWRRDGQTQQTTTVSQAGGPSLAASSDQFVLDEDLLGGGLYVSQFPEMSGSFKEIQLEFTKGGVSEDFEPHGFALEVESAGIGTTGVLG